MVVTVMGFSLYTFAKTKKVMKTVFPVKLTGVYYCQKIQRVYEKDYLQEQLITGAVKSSENEINCQRLMVLLVKKSISSNECCLRTHLLAFNCLSICFLSVYLYVCEWCACLLIRLSIHFIVHSYVFWFILTAHLMHLQVQT